MIKEFFFTNKYLPGLNPRTVGLEECAPGQSCGPEIRDTYLFQYIISGKGTFRVNQKTYRLSSGNLMIVPSNTMFYLEADQNDPWVYTWIDFDGDYAAVLDGLGHDFIKAESRYFDDFLACKNFPGREAEYLSGRLWIIISRILQEKNKGSYITAVKDYITANYMRSLNVEKIAGIIGISRKYLSRIFKESTGQSIQEFIISIRMHKARALLTNQRFSVKTTASLVGYSDVYAFSKIFKKVFSHPPKYYLDKQKSIEQKQK